MKKRLVLLGWYNPELVKTRLLLEFEENCRKYGILYPNAYELFQQIKSY